MIELLVASTLSLAIAAAALGLMDATTSVSNQELQRQAAIGEARAGLQRMVRELRGATSANSTAGNLLDFNAATPSGAKQIKNNGVWDSRVSTLQFATTLVYYRGAWQQCSSPPQPATTPATGCL